MARTRVIKGEAGTSAAEEQLEEPAAAQVEPQVRSAKVKRVLAGKVRALANLDYPYGTPRKPGEEFDMDEANVRHFLAQGGVELAD